MDKLELDARVARLERRVHGLSAAVALVGAMLAFTLFFAMAGRNASYPDLPAMVATPAPLSPPMPVASVTTTAMQPSEWTMPALQHQLSTFHDLRSQGLISEEEWEAKKAKLLSLPVTPGDIRSDLEQVEQLVEGHAICEGERDGLRAKLLEIEE